MQLENCPKIKIGKLIIQGHSRSGERTCFYIYGLKIMFDAGISTKIIPQTLMITHTHTDHIYNLPKTMYPGRSMSKLNQRPIYVPKPSILPIKNFIDSIVKLENCDMISQWSSRFNIVGVTKNQEYQLHNNYLMEVFECYHTIPCFGYGIMEKRTKLKKKYIDQDIGNLKKNLNFTELFDEKKIPLICYLGDTTPDVFINNPRLQSYPIIFIECTYLTSDMIENSKVNMHTNWIELKPWINKYQNTKFILIHFSLRYKDLEIKKFFDKEIDTMVNTNIYIWLDSGVISYR